MVCMPENVNKWYLSRICWSNMMGIDRTGAKLGGTEDDLNIVLYIFVPDLGNVVCVMSSSNISFGGRSS